jgi:hypothetical protein
VEQLTGAELALLYVATQKLGQSRLDIPVRFAETDHVVPLREAARQLEEFPAPLEVFGKKYGSTLVVSLVRSSIDATKHAQFVEQINADSQREFGTSGERGELLILGVPTVEPVGESRWSELEICQKRYLGDAWGGGISDPLHNFDPPIGVGYAAVVSLTDYMHAISGFDSAV